jgi:hypothetical protein
LPFIVARVAYSRYRATLRAVYTRDLAGKRTALADPAQRFSYRALY